MSDRHAGNGPRVELDWIHKRCAIRRIQAPDGKPVASRTGYSHNIAENDASVMAASACGLKP